MLKHRLCLCFLAALCAVISLGAETIAFTDTKPADSWTKKNFDSSNWLKAASWEEMSGQIKGEVWIRVEASYGVKEINNLVVTGNFAGELAMFVNGRKTYSIRDENEKESTWAFTQPGIGHYARPDEPTLFGFHYEPGKSRVPLCAVILKPLPVDYFYGNTPTKKYVVMEGDNYIRDTEMCVGRDGKYYLTGTSGTHDFMFNSEVGSDGKKHSWLYNQGVQIYQSDDLKHWKSLGYVWQFDRDGTWSKEIGKRDGSNARAVYAPEIHYFKKQDKYYIVYGPNTTRKNGMSFGIGILEAKEPRGPYMEITGTRPICGGFDGNLFQDDDGTTYLLHNGGEIMKLKDDLSAAAESERHLRPANYPRVGFEGVYLFKRNGIYYLTGADITAYKKGYSSYSTVVAMSTNIYGPYSNRYFAYPCAGHSCVFEAVNGQWYATSFTLPGASMFPGIFPVEFDADNRLVLTKSVGVPFDEEMARQKESSYQ